MAFMYVARYGAASTNDRRLCVSNILRHLGRERSIAFHVFEHMNWTFRVATLVLLVTHKQHQCSYTECPVDLSSQHQM